MADVWIINLKDFRDEPNNDDKKFNICMRNNIIAIGWGTKKSRREDNNYQIANKALTNMTKGDYVWTKNPRTQTDYYLLSVIDDEPDDFLAKGYKIFLDEDISKARRVKLIAQFTDGNLPNGITAKDIIAGHTAEMVHVEKVINATLDYVASF